MRDRQAITHVAGVPGLEPRLTEPESAGLPITPYPNTFHRVARWKVYLNKRVEITAAI